MNHPSSSSHSVPHYVNQEMIITTAPHFIIVFSILNSRILFCCFFLPDPPKIVFLDEATGHIDEKTEKLVESTVEEQFGDCTVLAIAHRLDTISGFDRFVKLENGKAIEVSKHQVVGNSAPLG